MSDVFGRGDESHGRADRAGASMTEIEALAVTVGVLDEDYQWWRDWAEMIVFCVGMYVFLVVGGCIGW